MLHPDEKRPLDDAIRLIVADPKIGELKKGDLAGVRVYKYRYHAQLLPIAYRLVDEEGVIKLLALGSHENFYRDLKRDQY